MAIHFLKMKSPQMHCILIIIIIDGLGGVQCNFFFFSNKSHINTTTLCFFSSCHFFLLKMIVNVSFICTCVK